MKRLNKTIFATGITGLSFLAAGCGGGQDGNGSAVSAPSVPDSVKEKINEAKDKVEENVEKAKEVVVEGADKAKEAVAEGADKAKEAVSAGIAKAKEAIDKIELPKLPEVDGFKTEFAKLVDSAKESIEAAKDSATAEAAAAKIRELTAKLEPVKAALAKIPEKAKELVDKYIVANAEYLKESAAKLYADSGIHEKLKPAVDELLAKIAELTK
jgi:hypothetical protein